MNDRLKNILLGFSALTALALGGAAIAGAASGNGSAGNSAAATTQSNAPPQGPRTTAVGRDTAER
jgi:hypothetical protein